MRRSSRSARNGKSTSLITEVNFTRAIEQTRWIFSQLGVWSMITNNTTSVERRLSVLVQIMCQSLLGFIIAPAFFHLYWCEINIKMKIALLGPVGVAVGCALKYATIIHRRDRIKRCIKQIEKDWNQMMNEECHEIMIKHMKMGKKVTTFCATLMYTGGISHQILAPFLPGSIISIVDNSSKRMLVYPVYDSMFNTEVTPVYEIMYLTHIFTGIIICTISIGACHLSILFIAHVSGQNEIMILKFRDLTDIQNERENMMNRRMCEIIQLHQKIIKFSSEVEQSLREVCLVAVVEALYIICTAQYYSITVNRLANYSLIETTMAFLLILVVNISLSALQAWKNNETFGAFIYFILVEAFILNCFIFCHVGELSKNQFDKVGQAAYMCEWHQLSCKNAGAMVLIIAATQHPPLITAGGLMELSYSGFISVLKTTAAYFNIMRMVEF